jgi:hypothetical protein
VGLMKASRFNAVYLALVALAWERLEELQLLLAQFPGSFSDPAQQRLIHLKLELLQLSESSALRSGTTQLTIRQNLVIQRFTGRILLALDGAYSASVEVLGCRISQVQDQLCDEALELGLSQSRRVRSARRVRSMHAGHLPSQVTSVTPIRHMRDIPSRQSRA